MSLKNFGICVGKVRYQITTEDMCDDVVAFNCKRVHKLGCTIGVESQPAEYQHELHIWGWGVFVQELLQVKSHNQRNAGPREQDCELTKGLGVISEGGNHICHYSLS